MQAIRIRSALLAAACLCGIAVPVAQQQPQQPPRPVGPFTGIIAGTVVDASTRKPIPLTMVGLAGAAAGPAGRGGAPRQLLTDNQGRFVFTGLGPGRYSLMTQRVGYFTTPVAFSRPIQLEPEQKVTDVTLRLHRLASIAGTVTDENGDAVTGVGVSPFRRAMQNGQPVWLPLGESRTDDRGMYRVTGLGAGEYVICACRRDPVPVDGVLLATLASEPAQLLGLASRALKVGADAAVIEGARTFPPTFAPGTLLMSRASHVTVSDGEDRIGVDVQMPVVRASRISGRVIGAPTAVNSSAIRLRLLGESMEGAPLIDPMLVQPDGRFDFVGIPPGTYVITALVPTVATSAPGPSGTALAFLGGRGLMPPPPPPPPPAPGTTPPDRILFWGQATVTVGDADVSGVTLPVQRAADVTVKLELPPDLGTPPAQAVRLAVLGPIGFDSRGLVPISRNNQNGTFVIPNVAPGRYALSLTTALQITSVRIGGRDVTDTPIDVGDAPPGEILVNLALPAPTVISGTVTDHDGDLCALIFPADPRLWVEPSAAQRWYSTTPVSRTGKFESNNNLVPGDYFVAIVPDEQSFDWQIKPKLEALAARAQKVTVAAGEKKVVEVKR